MAESFVAWVHALVSAIAHAKDQPEHREAQQRSDTSRSQRGLTADQPEARDVQDAAQGDLNWARRLQAQLRHSKSTGKKTSKRNHRATEHALNSWHEMWANEQCWLQKPLEWKFDVGTKFTCKSMDDGHRCPKSSREMSIHDRWYLGQVEH